MRYICLGYMEETRWDQMSEKERNTFMAEAMTYDAELQRNGHMVGGEALQSTRNAATLRYQEGQVAITDGPFAETREQLGGIMILEARDLNHAIQLLSKHPSLRMVHSTWEIRPAATLPDLSTLQEK
jgi:hypothetical protein